jgi:transcription elongation GreA/GreB family factor
MSRAFVKEPDGNEAFNELPERLISEHPNLVTLEGLEFIEAQLAHLAREYAAAQASGERAALNAAARDLRYWSARRASADVMPDPPDCGHVHFGSVVTISRDDGRRHTYRIVGEDEADPARGLLSYVSPLARALLGKQEGDTVRVANADALIVAITAH